MVVVSFGRQWKFNASGGEAAVASKNPQKAPHTEALCAVRTEGSTNGSCVEGIDCEIDLGRRQLLW